MEVRALFGRFFWRGININDVTIHPSQGSRIKPTLKVCEHNRAAHASLGLLASQYTGKNAGILVKYQTSSFWHCGGEKSLSIHDVPQHRNDSNLSRKCTTSLIRHQNHNSELVDRRWHRFSPSHTCVKCFTCRLVCADTSKCGHCLLKRNLRLEARSWTPEESRAFNATYRCHDYI